MPPGRRRSQSERKVARISDRRRFERAPFPPFCIPASPTRSALPRAQIYVIRCTSTLVHAVIRAPARMERGRGGGAARGARRGQLGGYGGGDSEAPGCGGGSSGAGGWPAVMQAALPGDLCFLSRADRRVGRTFSGGRPVRAGRGHAGKRSGRDNPGAVQYRRVRESSENACLARTWRGALQQDQAPRGGAARISNARRTHLPLGPCRGIVSPRMRMLMLVPTSASVTTPVQD